MFESARAQLGQAERTHASNQRLADQQFISPIALETSRSALDAAQAQVRAAQAALDSTRAGARESTLLAPIAVRSYEFVIGSRTRGRAEPGSLTPQQRIVLTHLVHGRLNKQIAHDLSVSMTTVKAHVSAILQKLNVFSRTQAVILANRVHFDGDN
jgi:DNA-binding NarL/FixJ family response regulator